MRTLVLATILLPLSGFAQNLLPVAPPTDPLEPVTGEALTVTTAEQRAAMVELMSRAQDQYAMHAKVSAPHILQIAFNATASTLFPGGAGQLRETWISGQNWRWDATLGNYSLLRISSNGVAYDQQAPRAMPLRLKMLANAVLAPLQNAAPRQANLRTASVEWKGAQVTCILLSFQGASELPAAIGRQWDETEYCIDPSTSLLKIFSEAPGIYVTCDYSNALRFHGHTLPGGVTITENGNAVVQAQLTSIVDTDPSNSSPFTATAQMKAQGPAVVIMLPLRMSRLVPSPDVQPGAPIHPTVVHVTLDDLGNVQESEVLQTSSLSAQALEAATKTKMFGPVQKAPGTPPRQREAYVRVEFIPAGLIGQ